MEYNGKSIKQTPVHKQDAEGVLLIDSLTGHVITDQHDRPEWAEGLVLAQLAERHLWYVNRLGPAYTDDMKSPEMLAYEDLGWCKMIATEDGLDMQEAYHDADPQFRMEVLANVLGIDITTHDEELALASLKGIVAETHIARDDTRTEAELADLKVAQTERFEVVEGGKTGTHG